MYALFVTTCSSLDIVAIVMMGVSAGAIDGEAFCAVTFDAAGCKLRPPAG
jgi:hypothetical protein